MALYRCGTNSNTSQTDALSHFNYHTGSAGTTDSISVSVKGGESYYILVGGHRVTRGTANYAITSSNGDTLNITIYYTGSNEGQGNTMNGFTTVPYVPSSDTTITLKESVPSGADVFDEAFIAAIHTDHLG